MFDIEGARKEGYSDSEIASYLAKEKGFDLAGARKEGYSDTEIINHLQPPKIDFAGMLGGAVKNFIPDAANVAKQAYEGLTGIGAGIISMMLPESAFKQTPEAQAARAQYEQAARYPKQAFEGLTDVGAGAISKMLPDWAFKQTPEAQAKREQYQGAAEQFGEHYKERYGGVENIKKAISEHPAETGLDVLTVLSPISSLVKGKGVIPAPALAPEAQSALSLAKEAKIPLSATAVNPVSKIGQAFEWVGEALPTGKAWATMKRQQLQTGLTRIMEDTLGKLPARTDQFDAGATLGKGLQEAKGTLKAGEKAAYGKWETALGDKPRIMDELTQAIGDAKEGVGGDTRAWLEAYSKKGTEWTPADIDAFQKQLWSKTWNTDVKGGDLLEALKKDLAKPTEGMGPSDVPVLLDQAKEASKLYRAFAKNDTVRAITRKYAQDPEQAIRAAFRSGNMEDIGLIKKALDPETWDIARSRFVENLFDASTELQGTQKIFNPQKFSDIFEKYSRQIKQVMPEKYDSIKQFADLSKYAVSDLNKMNMGKLQTGWQTAAAAATGYGALAGNVGMVVPAGFSFAVTKSLWNPSGWLKKWLTEGYKLPDLSKTPRRVNALNIAGRPAVAQDEQ